MYNLFILELGNVYILCVLYINTTTYSIYFENIDMHVCIYIYIIHINSTHTYIM